MTIHSEQDSVTLTLSMNRNSAPRGPIAAALLSTLHQWLNVGVTEIEARDIAFDLYPVPASDRVHIICEQLPSVERIDVINVTGTVVRSMRPSANTTMDIDVADLASGMYQVRLVSAHGYSSRPLIVE